LLTAVCQSQGEERIKQERENKDIRDQQIVLKAIEMRKTGPLAGLFPMFIYYLTSYGCSL
jgi:hypothetical protein